MTDPGSVNLSQVDSIPQTYVLCRGEGAPQEVLLASPDIGGDATLMAAMMEVAIQATIQTGAPPNFEAVVHTPATTLLM